MARPSARVRKTPKKAVAKPPIVGTSAKSRKKSGFTIYIDDDDTPPPEIGLGTASKVTKPLASSSDYGGSSDNEGLIAAAARVELMRSWVDCGIQMAIKEIEAEKLGGSIYKDNCEPHSALSQSSQAPYPKSNQPPQTPTSKIYQHNAPYATPSQSQNSHPQYCNEVPQHQQMGTSQGYQNYPTASMSPQSQGYYTPQHGITYAPQNPSHCPLQGYYVTPPTSQPPLLQSSAPFSSSAPPQSSPTPQPHVMTAFHNGSIPQSSGSAPTNRQPLTPASSNIQTPKSSTKDKATEQPFVLPPGQYLSWHQLQRHYGPVWQKFPQS